jgi:hypothetical protein
MKRVKENRDAFKGTGHTEIFIFNFNFNFSFSFKIPKKIAGSILRRHMYESKK